MTISVIIPVYKVEKYVRRCIESVVAQECDNFNLECLIIDDCTPDNSMAIVQDVINGYTGTSIVFKIIRHDKNMGLSAARNTGIKASTGDFLFFIDSDDDILENTFKSFVKYLSVYPSTDVIMGNSLWAEQKELYNIHVTNNYKTPLLIENRQTILLYMLRRKIERTAWNKLVRRKLVVDYDLYFDNGLLYEDITWSYRLFSCVSSILLVPELTYMYEYNPSSIVHTPSERINQMVRSFALISDYLLDNPPILDGKKRFYTAHRLFVHYWLLKAIDLKEQHGADVPTSNKLDSLKRRLLWDSVCHVRPFMTLFFLTMFKPFSRMMRIKAFRANIDRISRLVYRLS